MISPSPLPQTLHRHGFVPKQRLKSSNLDKMFFFNIVPFHTRSTKTLTK